MFSPLIIGTTKIKPSRTPRFNLPRFPGIYYEKTPLESACKSGHADIIALFMLLIPTDDMNRCLHWVQGAKGLEAILKTGHTNVDCFKGGKT